MESMDYWRLCDELSVIHAALLIAGVDPTEYEYVENWEISKRPKGYEAAKTALINIVLSGRIPAMLRHSARERGYAEDISEGEFIGRDARGYDIIYSATPDWNLTTIRVDDLRVWLKSRGFDSGFFFPQIESDTPDYLDNTHSNYSPKLAAAIEAWKSVTANPDLVKAKSVKQAIMIWLRSHAGRFGLIKEDGNPNESGIEEVAKVANWETKGGAPKTPEA